MSNLGEQKRLQNDPKNEVLMKISSLVSLLTALKLLASYHPRLFLARLLYGRSRPGRRA